MGLFSRLPGQVVPLKPGKVTCYTEGHENVMALYRHIGETDSFGYEYEDYCQECSDRATAEREKFLEEDKESHCCDWCKKAVVGMKNMVHTRDSGEGDNGPVYLVCRACKQRDIRDAEEELDYYRDLENARVADAKREEELWEQFYRDEMSSK